MKKQQKELENQSADSAKNLLNNQEGDIATSTPAPASKTSSQTSWVKKLKLDTGIGKLIAFALAFALAGGIYLVFRSFASTGELSGVLFLTRIEEVTEVTTKYDHYIYDIASNELTVKQNLFGDTDQKVNSAGDTLLNMSTSSASDLVFSTKNIFDGAQQEIYRQARSERWSTTRYDWMPGSSTDFIYTEDIYLDNKYGTEIAIVRGSTKTVVKVAERGHDFRIIGDSNGSIYLFETIFFSEQEGGGIEDIRLIRVDNDGSIEAVKSGFFNSELRNAGGASSISPTNEEILMVTNDPEKGQEIVTFDFDYNVINTVNIDNIYDGYDGGTHFSHGWSPDGQYFFLQNLIFNRDGKLIRTVGDSKNNIYDWSIKAPKPVEPVSIGVFKPTSPTTRGDMAVFLNWAKGKPVASNTKCGFGQPGPFPDVPGNHGFCREIEWMSQQNITSGFTDGTFRPDAAVTRQAMSAFLYRSQGRPNVPTASTKCGSGKPGPFTDVKGTHAFCKEIEWMRAEGISVGFKDGSYKPTINVSRQAMAAFLHRIEGGPTASQVEPYWTDVSTTHPFFNSIQWLGEKSVQ